MPAPPPATRAPSGPAAGVEAAGPAAAFALALAWPWALSWQATFGGLGPGAPPHVALYLLAGTTAALGVASARRGRPGAGGPPDDTAGSGSAARWTARAPAVPAVVLAAVAGALAWDLSWHGGRCPCAHLLTPPHALLAAASLALVLHGGAAAARRRGPAGGTADRSARGGWSAGATVLLGGALLILAGVLGHEYLGRPNLWRGSGFYEAAGLLVPWALVGASRASRSAWGASLAAVGSLGGALLLWAGLWWTSPPDPGPAAFSLPHVPLLLLVPAVVADGIESGARAFRSSLVRLVRPLVHGPAFVASTLAVHWPLAGLLVSGGPQGPLARTWPAGAPGADHLGGFWSLDGGTIPFVQGLALAILWATLSAGLGLALARAAERDPTTDPEVEP